MVSFCESKAHDWSLIWYLPFHQKKVAPTTSLNLQKPSNLILATYMLGNLKNCNSVKYFTFYIPTCKIWGQFIPWLLRKCRIPHLNKMALIQYVIISNFKNDTYTQVSLHVRVMCYINHFNWERIALSSENLQ